MLESMRKLAKHFVIKALLGLLVLSFIIWGVGDVFRGQTGNVIAKVGDESISLSDFERTLQMETQRYQQIFGQVMTEEQIERLGLKRIVLEQMVENKLIRKRVNDLKLHVGNDAAKEQIMANSLFADKDGKFDKNAFDAILRSSGLNPDDYITALKQDTAVRLLIDTMSAVPLSVKEQAALLYSYRNEQRYADLVTIPASYVKNVEEPTDTDLVQYYQEHTKEFAVPEMREATYVKVSLEDIANELAVDEVEAKTEYDANLGNYQVSEQRAVEQFLFDSETDAKNALTSLKEGKAGVYADKKNDLGNVTKDALPPEVSEAVFTLEKGAYSEPVKSQLGWHIFIVNDITADHTQPFEQVKEAIIKDIKERKASDLFYEYANKIEDEFASGVSMEDLAKKFDLVIHKVPAVDKEGKGAGGKVLSDIPEPEVFLPLVFNTDAGAESPMTLLSDQTTYVTVRVDEVTPERVKALDEAKGLAIELWKEQKKVTKLADAAKEVAAKIKAGGDAKSVAKSMGLTLDISKKIQRPVESAFNEPQEGVPSALAKEVFSVNAKETTQAVKNAEGNYVVAQLVEVRPAEENADKLKALEDELKQDYADDILRQYSEFLHKEYPVCGTSLAPAGLLKPC